MSIREALEKARMALVATDGMYATDKPDHIPRDIDQFFGQLNNSVELAAIDKALESAFDPIADIKAFHEKFALRYDGKPRCLPTELSNFRIEFMHEELKEYRDSIIASTESGYYLAEQLDALVDLVYVALGTAYLQGFDFREAWRRVHEANMKKVRARGAADSSRPDGWQFDIVKPPGWQAPDHSDLVSDNEEP